nr:unnamed protein product [Callosobruchus analis]
METLAVSVRIPVRIISEWNGESRDKCLVIKYKKRKTRDRANMISAVAAVQTKIMGYLKASKTFSVPRATLFRFVKEKNDS